jgi:hypothetical protein
MSGSSVVAMLMEEDAGTVVLSANRSRKPRVSGLEFGDNVRQDGTQCLAFAI